MLHTNNPIIKHKAGLLNLVEERFKRKSSAVIISAAESKESALEGYKDHGLFTYAVVWDRHRLPDDEYLD